MFGQQANMKINIHFTLYPVACSVDAMIALTFYMFHITFFYLQTEKSTILHKRSFSYLHVSRNVCLIYRFELDSQTNTVQHVYNSSHQTVQDVVVFVLDTLVNSMNSAVEFRKKNEQKKKLQFQAKLTANIKPTLNTAWIFNFTDATKRTTTHDAVVSYYKFILF